MGQHPPVNGKGTEATGTQWVQGAGWSEGKGSGGGRAYRCCSRSQVRRGRERDVDGQVEVPTKRGFLSFLKEGLKRE